MTASAIVCHRIGDCRDNPGMQEFSGRVTADIVTGGIRPLALPPTAPLIFIPPDADPHGLRLEIW